jgi:hypothetical protein
VDLWALVAVVLGVLLGWVAHRRNWGDFWKKMFWRVVGFSGFFMVLTILPAHYRLDRDLVWRELCVALLALVAAAWGFFLAWVAHWGKWGSPWKLVFGGIVFFSILLAALAFVGTTSAISRWAVGVLNVPEEYDLFLTYFTVLLRLMGIGFFLLGTAIVLALVPWLIALCLHGDAQRRSLNAALGAVFIQVGLWALLVPALGMLACTSFYPEMLVRKDLPFAGAMVGFVWHFFLALIVGLPVLVTLIWRSLWVFFNKPNFRDPDAIPRLLVNPWVLWTVLGAGIAGGGLFVWRQWIGRWPWDDVFFRLAVPLAGGTAVVLPLVGTYFRKELAAVLHIFMDVIAHFYEKDLDFPRPFGKPKVINVESFVVQMRIEARMRRVIQEVLWRLDGYNVTDLTVVAHSQGTVIAIDVLWLAWTHRLLKEGRQITVRLATMGSPFTYLYQYFYPSRYPELFDDHGKLNKPWVPKVAGVLDWAKGFDKTVQKWVNLYRVDDFVGTRINGRQSFPDNIPVGAGGHNYYWNQPQVLELLRQLLPGA